MINQVKRCLLWPVQAPGAGSSAAPLGRPGGTAGPMAGPGRNRTAPSSIGGAGGSTPDSLSRQPSDAGAALGGMTAGLGGGAGREGGGGGGGSGGGRGGGGTAEEEGMGRQMFAVLERLACALERLQVRPGVQGGLAGRGRQGWRRGQHE